MGHEAAHYYPEQLPATFSAPHRSPQTDSFPDDHNVLSHQPDETVPPTSSVSYDLSRHAHFLSRFERLQPRIEQIVRAQWGPELDPFETDNLIQAAYVHLWMGYERIPEKFDAHGDGYWYAVAKRGASNEFIQEFRQRYRQKGTGSSKNRQNVEVVANSGDLLASIRSTKHELTPANEDVDETFLQQGVIYSHDATSYQEIDTRLDVERLVAIVYSGTAIKDHPRITRILDWMKEGCSLAEMARREGVNQGTIKCMVRRIRQACGASSSAKENHQHRHHGTSKDEHIRKLFGQGLKAPEISRLIGTDHSFVYRRLHALKLIGDRADEMSVSHAEDLDSC